MNFFTMNNKLGCGYKSYPLSDIAVSVEYPGEHYDTIKLKSTAWQKSKNGLTATTEIKGVGAVTLRVTKRNGGLILQAALKTNSDFEARKLSAFVISGVTPIHADVMSFNALHSYHHLRTFEMESNVKTVATVSNQKERAVDYMAFKGNYNGKKDIYGVFGFISFAQHFGEITLCENGVFQIRTNLENATYAPDTTIKTDKCFFYAERGNKDILSVYGREIAKENKAEPLTDIPTGWCSWYYYGSGISQDIILENARLLKQNSLPVKYVQIDDGWQNNNGDWEANEKFPDGMKALADNIRREGFIPGIWFSPFLFSPESKVFKEHPEWFIHRPDGTTDSRRFIDYSIKGAREWLAGVARKLSVEWGYRYIKIDYITPGISDYGYKKKDFNSIKNFREAIKTVRSAVTEDTLILNCTSSVSASAGLSDSVRVSVDIFEGWDSLKYVANQVLCRYFTSEFIVPDPDCLMVRTESQHDSEAFRICTRDENEIRTFVTFISAAGGTLMLSDKLALLTDADIEKIKTLFPINSKPAKPLDLFERAVPSILYYGERDGLEIYALFNWEDKTDTLELKFNSKRYVKGFYSGKEYSVPRIFSIKLEPHSCEVVYVAKNKEDLPKAGNGILPE